MQRINGHKTQKSDILENQTGLGQSKKLTSQWRQKKQEVWMLKIIAVATNSVS